MTSRPSYPVARGFSLVETVLALGIMGLAITALLGLIPHGLEMSKKAADASAEARIVETVRGLLSNNRFNSLTTMAETLLHFDDEGVLVDNTEEKQNFSYQVQVEPVLAAGKILLPGGTTPDGTLLHFKIKIAASRQPNFDFSTSKSRNYHTVAVLIGPSIP